MNLRQLHRYLSVFFTPAILFFAISGGLQTFGLHESAVRGASPPVAWIAAMASVHKDQHLPRVHARVGAPAVRRLAPHETSAPQTVTDVPSSVEKSTLPLKLFVLALAVGLCVTAIAGLTVAFSNPRNRTQNAVTLVLGALLPTALLFL